MLHKLVKEIDFSAVLFSAVEVDEVGRWDRDREGEGESEIGWG